MPLLRSSPAVLIRSGALGRSGRVYLDTAPAMRDGDGGQIERGERRYASASDDVVVSNKSHTPGHRRGRCARRRERALPVDRRVARAWRASARRRSAVRRTWNVETANRLLRFRREDTRRQGAGGLVIEHHRPLPGLLVCPCFLGCAVAVWGHLGFVAVAGCCCCAGGGGLLPGIKHGIKE